MSINDTAPLATVTDISGKVWMVGEDGNRHLLREGDVVYDGEVILTEQGSTVVLRTANGADLRVTEGKEVALSGGLFGREENTWNIDLRGLIAATDTTPSTGTSESSVVVPSVLPDNQGVAADQSGMQTLHGFLQVERIIESVTTPAYRLWSFTGNYDPENQFRTSSYDSFLDGRATVDERIVMPLEPLVFSDVEPLPEPKTIVLEPHAVSLIPQETISVNPSSPEPGDFQPISVTVAVQEDALPGGNREGTQQTTTATGNFPTVGVNGPITFSLQQPVLEPDLTSKGEPISYVVAGNVLTGYVDLDPFFGPGYDEGSDRPVFTLELSGTNNAEYTFTLLGQLDHNGPLASGIGDSQLLTLYLSGFILVTDNDGNPVTDNEGNPVIVDFTVTVEDDLPAQTTTTITSAVQEDALSGGNRETTQQTTTATGSIATLVSVGADEPVTYSVQALGLPALFSKGETVSYSAVDTNSDSIADTLKATAGTRDIFTLTLDQSSGGYTYTLQGQLDHTGSLVSGTGDSQLLTLDLSGGLVATDKDGDQITIDTGSLLITVEDDLPAQTTTTITSAV
ncbi:MAG: hypothetical protein WCI01_00215, partial [Chlorobiaceae bacterium]